MSCGLSVMGTRSRHRGSVGAKIESTRLPRTGRSLLWLSPTPLAVWGCGSGPDAGLARRSAQCCRISAADRHAQPSITRDVFMGRRVANSDAARARQMSKRALNGHWPQPSRAEASAVVLSQCAVRDLNPEPADSDYSVVDSCR